MNALPMLAAAPGPASAAPAFPPGYRVCVATMGCRVNRYDAALLRRPQARVAVTGCYAEVAPGALSALPEVDLVAGNRDKPDLARRLTALARDRAA